jgi:hypothetical protein
MPEHILTDVSATVDSEKHQQLVAAFQALGAEPMPDGLVRTELLRGREGLWRIQTLWRDREALDAMIASSEVPAARRLFQDVGATSALQVYEVRAEHPAAPAAEPAGT